MLQCIESAVQWTVTANESLRTWHNISRIHGIFVFDEAKPIHELNLCDFASSMCAEVIFNILLGS